MALQHSDTPNPASSRSIPLKMLPTWQVPAWLNVGLMVGPFLGLYQGFGRISGSDAVWAWGVLAAIAAAVTLLVRGRPLTRIHPLGWRQRPWVLAGMTGFIWIIILSTGAGEGLLYGILGLAVAFSHVLLTTSGGEDAPRFGETVRPS